MTRKNKPVIAFVCIENSCRSQIAEAFEGEEIEALITMGCGDSCPNISSKQNIDWQIPDPKHMSLDEFRSVRDHIRGRVDGLFKSLLNC